MNTDTILNLIFNMKIAISKYCKYLYFYISKHVTSLPDKIQRLKEKKKRKKNREFAFSPLYNLII